MFTISSQALGLTYSSPDELIQAIWSVGEADDSTCQGNDADDIDAMLACIGLNAAVSTMQ